MRVATGVWWLKVQKLIAVQCDCTRKFFISQFKKFIKCPHCGLLSHSRWVHEKYTRPSPTNESGPKDGGNKGARLGDGS